MTTRAWVRPSSLRSWRTIASIVGSVGDSRLYLLSGGSLAQMTQDDTWAATMLAERGAKDPIALAHHPMRHVLTNVLGARDTTNVHISEHVLTAGDTVMLCSDGLYGVVDDATLLARDAGKR